MCLVSRYWSSRYGKWMHRKPAATASPPRPEWVGDFADQQEENEDDADLSSPDDASNDEENTVAETNRENRTGGDSQTPKAKVKTSAQVKTTAVEANL